ncbi:MAG: hypothetical protein J5879_02615 [Clostridia bacterium]|nr:hypothetical protein [Clostridia bacterium]
MSVSVLGIDTSNYTTSLSVCEDGAIVRNVKIPLKVQKGGVGLRQSDAVFSHTVNLPEAFEQLGYDLKNISAVGYSDRPRGVQGSYMPCFLCGKSAAAAVSAALGVKTYCNSHQEGHIRAAVYSSGMPEYERFYAYHISGGTLELLTVTVKEDSYDCSITGRTLDVTAGQIIDRTGVMLGLDFPCGRALQELSLKNCDPLPPVKVCVSGCDCNLSGVQNKAEQLFKDGAPHPLIAAYVIEYIRKTIDKMTRSALEAEKLPLLFSGGVASNITLKEYFTKEYGAYFASPEFSSDNAAGTALLTYRKVINGE